MCMSFTLIHIYNIIFFCWISGELVNIKIVCMMLYCLDCLGPVLVTVLAVAPAASTPSHRWLRRSAYGEEGALLPGGREHFIHLQELY